MKLLCILIGRIIYNIRKINNYFVRRYQLSKFKSAGNDVYLSSNCEFIEENISIGSDVYIGKNCCFQSDHGEIIIGNHVMFGPNVHIHGGNHSFNKIGYYMKECHNKEHSSDGKVTICDDVWIGAGAIILKGVTIGQGSVIGAGSIVTKSIEPYTVYTGVPSQKIKNRWSHEEILEHERILQDRGK